MQIIRNRVRDKIAKLLVGLAIVLLLPLTAQLAAAQQDAGAAGSQGSAAGSQGSAAGSQGSAASSQGSAAGSEGSAASSQRSAAGSEGSAAGSATTAEPAAGSGESSAASSPPAEPAAGPPDVPMKTPAGERTKPKAAAAPKPKTNFNIVYLSKEYPEPPPLTIAEDIITDKGIQGARVGIDDNNKTGGFVGQHYELTEAIIPANGDIVAKAKEVLKGGDAIIVADLKARDLLKVADLPEAKNSIILSIRDSDDKLRQANCRYNVLHVVPSWTMRADAVAQYLVYRQWPRWFLIKGKHREDERFVAAANRAAKRFGGDIVEEREYQFETGARRLDSGHQQVQSQMPIATQNAPDHDVIWVADTQDGFGEYLTYRSYVPRPVVGTQGMRPVAWDDSYTEYGGMAFQRALEDKANRKSVERDYTAWLALRTVGEAALRSNKSKVTELRDFILSDEFKVAGYKGEAMNFRSWDHQMRQPILLAGERTIVSVSPQEGFLHPKYLTDTLGYDEGESSCEFDRG